MHTHKLPAVLRFCIDIKPQLAAAMSHMNLEDLKKKKKKS